MSIRTLASSSLLIATLFARTASSQEVAEYYQLRSKGEQQYAQGNLESSSEYYSKLSELQLSPLAEAWVKFRLADMAWRLAPEKDLDASKVASKELKSLFTQTGDRVRAEIAESLADLYWTHSAKNSDFSEARPYYSVAAKFWLGAVPDKTAETRILKLFGKMAEPPWKKSTSIYGDFGNLIPIELLDEAIEKFRDKNALAPLHYLRAKTLASNATDPGQYPVIEKEFRAAIAAPKEMPYTDDALFDYARFLDRISANWNASNLEKSSPSEKILRELLSRFGDSSPYSQRAREMLKALNTPFLDVTVKNFDTRETPIIEISSRGHTAVKFTLTKIDIARDFDPESKAAKQSSWLGNKWSSLLTPRGTTFAWDEKLTNGRQRLGFKRNLSPGLYVLGYNDKTTSFLISDLLLIPKLVGENALLITAINLIDGSPKSETKITLYQRRRHGLDSVLRKLTAVSDTRGIATFELPIRLPTIAEKVADAEAGWNLEFMVLGEVNNNQALLLFGPHERFERSESAILPFVARKSICPGEPLIWSLLVTSKSPFQPLKYRDIHVTLTHPKGAKLKVVDASLDEFGRTSGLVRVPGNWKAGEYRLNFDDSEDNSLASVSFLRKENCD